MRTVDIFLMRVQIKKNISYVNMVDTGYQKALIPFKPNWITQVNNNIKTKERHIQCAAAYKYLADQMSSCLSHIIARLLKWIYNLFHNVCKNVRKVRHLKNLTNSYTNAMRNWVL